MPVWLSVTGVSLMQVHNVGQLKYVVDEDLATIGMSKPECRRLKTFFNKYCPGNYASKIRYEYRTAIPSKGSI